MAPDKSYFDSISTPTAYRREAHSVDDDKSVSEILDKTSASKWDRSHLVALHVLVRGKRDNMLLPLISANATAMGCIAILTSTMSTDVSPFWSQYPATRTALSDRLRGRDRIGDQSTLSEYELSKNGEDPSLGRIWAALNRLEAPLGSLVAPDVDEYSITHFSGNHAANDHNHDDSDDSGDNSSPSHGEQNNAPATPPTPNLPPSKRTRRAPPAYPGMVAMADTSPGTAPATSSPHSAFTPDYEATSGRSSAEDLTFDFIAAVLRHLLLHVPPQHAYKPEEGDTAPLDFDALKLPLRSVISSRVVFTSVDDGGLWIKPLSKVSRARVAILETKRFITRIVNGKPDFSDALLAQVVGESLAVRLGKDLWLGPKESIIVIVAARYFVRFLEIEISDQYLNSLKKHIHEKAPFQEFINVQHTRWFDFRDATDRLQIMRNVSGIVAVTQQAFESFQHAPLETVTRGATASKPKKPVDRLKEAVGSRLPIIDSSDDKALSNIHDPGFVAEGHMTVGNYRLPVATRAETGASKKRKRFITSTEENAREKHDMTRTAKAEVGEVLASLWAKKVPHDIEEIASLKKVLVMAVSPTADAELRKVLEQRRSWLASKQDERARTELGFRAVEEEFKTIEQGLV
ncbi:hypothetical protein EsH8_XI_000070 [Colletotrichum jinshuiense]